MQAKASEVELDTQGACDDVLLVRSRHFGWEGVSSVVRHSAAVRLVGVTGLSREAIRLAGKMRPAFIVSTSQPEGMELESFVQELHIGSPMSKVVVIADSPGLELVAVLEQDSVDGVLLWDTVQPETIESTLRGVKSGLWAGSPAVVAALAGLGNGHRQHTQIPLALTKRQEAVLHWLAQGLTEEQIAGKEGVQVRTIERTVADLLLKFDLPSILQLRLLARDHRY